MKQLAQNIISKIIFGFPIALFFGIGIFVSTDIIQPSYFRNLSVYIYYFIASIFVGYLSLFLASIYISQCVNKIKAYICMTVYMTVEALFSFLAINTYYGSENIPIIRQITAICLPLVFSLFYFMNLIDHGNKQKIVKYTKDEAELFKAFDDIESSKPDI